MEIKNALFAIDSFKGSMTSLQAGRAAAAGLKKVFPRAKIKILASADGGEGTLSALKKIYKMRAVSVKACDPLGRPLNARYAASKSAALIELAAASGLCLLNANELAPLNTSTYGTGLQILHAVESGRHNITLAIGGSATNDAGIGILAALGFEFFDAANKPVKDFCGGALLKIKRISRRRAHPKLKACRFTVLCDVKNPFYGKNGAAHVYAPQKGANKKDVSLLDRGLKNIAAVFKKDFGANIAKLEGAGAAGGVGGGLAAVLNASLESGISAVLKAQNFAKDAAKADAVFCGEGSLDAQTLMGKSPHITALKARLCGAKKVYVVCGRFEHHLLNKFKKIFDGIIAVSPIDMPLKQSLITKNAKSNTERAVAEFFKKNS